MSLSLRTAALTAICLAIASASIAAQSSSATRAAELAESFNKSKHVARTVRGERREKFREVVATPLSVGSPKEYSGSYADDGLGVALDLAIDSSGRGAGWGKEPRDEGVTSPRWFTLENVRVDGALLTATKKYESGATEPFEAIFLTRRDRSHPDSAATVLTGIGVLLRRPLQVTSGIQVTRYFMTRSE